MLLVNDIHKGFSQPVLKGITMQVNYGEVIGIAGENGSGKSTLLSIIAGLLLPDLGQVTVEGKIGYVPQETALFDNLSIKDNLRFWASAYGVSLKEAEAFTLGLDLKKKVRYLSGGMKKRLSIALAGLHRPDWLIMDEPSAALDIAFKGELAKMIEEAKTQARGVIFTSHQPDELHWCDRIYILREGVFVYEGAPTEIGSLAKILYGRS